jgi:hypothetical protein
MRGRTPARDAADEPRRDTAGSEGLRSGAVRVLFVVDTSQSTAVNDPLMLRKSEPRRAVDLCAGYPDASFAFIRFSASALVLTSFTTDADKLNVALDALTPSAGVASFIEGTAATLAFLADDVAQPKPMPNADTRYAVFFLADGFDSAGNNATILRTVAEIAKLASSVKEVRFHTALVAQNIDPLAVTQLSAMAKAGGGTFTNYGAGLTIDFLQTIAP